VRINKREASALLASLN